MPIKTVIFLLLCLVIAACSSKNRGELLAKAGGYKLYQADIAGLVPPTVKGNDSISIVKAYIDEWIKQHLLVELAEGQVGDELDADRKVEEYRKSLLVHAYQEKYLKENLDTLIADKDIEAYYKANINNFKLKSNILQVVYVKVGKQAPQQEKVKQWVRNSTPADLKTLEAYCVDNAQNFFLEQGQWLLYDDLLKEMPLEKYVGSSITAPRFIEMEDSASVYFVNIKDFQTKETASPLSFAKDRIKNIILNKRKTDLLRKLEDTLFKTALEEGDFTIYSEQKK